MFYTNFPKCLLKGISLFFLVFTFGCSVDYISEKDSFSQEELMNQHGHLFVKPSQSAILRLKEFTSESYSLNNHNYLFKYFDYGNPISYYHNEVEIVILNQKESLGSQKFKYALVYLNRNYLDEFFIVRTSPIQNGFAEAEYISAKSGNSLFKINFNISEQSASFDSFLSFTKKESVLRNNSYDPDYDCEASWGQNTSICLEDVYTNYGWVSVWAFVQSSFIPATAAALAAACAIDAYNPYDGGGCYTDQGGGIIDQLPQPPCHPYPQCL